MRLPCWLSLGANLVPLKANSKHILAGFGPRQRKLCEGFSIRYWFEQKASPFNLGLVLGGLPGLMVLDFDQASLFEAWRTGPGAHVHTRIEQSVRGFHVFFATTRAITGKSCEGLEVKCSGVVALAPSVVQGYRYRVIADDPITSFLPAYLPPPFFSLSASPPPIPARRPVTERNDLLARIKAAHSIREAVVRYFPSVTLAGAGRFQHGRCPFHEDQRASFWIDNQLNTWGCLASSCPQRGTHDVINLVQAALSLSLRDAIRLLAREVGSEH